jgi:hypothetical protein
MKGSNIIRIFYNLEVSNSFFFFGLSPLGLLVIRICVGLYYLGDRLCGLVDEFLVTDPEVPVSTPSATRFSEK